MSEWLKERLRANKLTEEKRLNKQSVKAKELYEKFESYSYADYDNFTGFDMKSHKENTKQCALICLDRSIKLLKEIQENEHSDNFWVLESAIQDEIELKQELEKCLNPTPLQSKR